MWPYVFTCFLKYYESYNFGGKVMEQALREMYHASSLCKYVFDICSSRHTRCSLFQGSGQFVIFLELLPAVLQAESLELIAF